MSELKGTVATEGNLSGTLNTEKGYDGKSAYEIALAHGFNGTEEEWLNSLEGKSGVYLGSGDMPEDCNVQIDPNGETLTLDYYLGDVNAALDSIIELQENLIGGDT